MIVYLDHINANVMLIGRGKIAQKKLSIVAVNKTRMTMRVNMEHVKPRQLV